MSPWIRTAATCGMWAATAGLAWAADDPKCGGLLPPDNYDEQVQADFLSNYPVLATTFSPLHGPIPHDAGRGAIGVDLAVIPPLGCDRRAVLNYTKFEDTNKTPVVPRPSASFTFKPLFGKVYPYAGLGFVPPVPVGGTTTMVASAELGAGVQLGEAFQTGLRVHGTLHRTVGDVATKFEGEEFDYLDVYFASSQGVDAMLGWKTDAVTPYASVGWTDVSTYFWIGDDGYVSNNLHPYSGLALSLGVDTLLGDALRLGAELYSAPGGYSLPDPDVPSVDRAARYGNLTTGRLRLAYEL